MNYALKHRLIALILTIGAISLTGCATGPGVGIKSVTCESIDFVKLSHKDTQGTIQQVAENNGVLRTLGCKPGDVKR